MTIESSQAYLPAAGRDCLLPFYDPIVKLLGGDAARKALVDQATLHPAQRVLEVGCGTGTLVIQIKQLYPQTEVVGLDPDPKALTRAKHKASRASVGIQFDHGFAGELPYPDASFHHVFSSFMFHHLPADEKRKMLCEVRRVLKPVGEFHMLDFEGPDDGNHGILSHLLHSNERLKDNSEASVLRLMRQCGFGHANKTSRRTMLFGNAGYFRASI